MHWIAVMPALHSLRVRLIVVITLIVVAACSILALFSMSQQARLTDRALAMEGTCTGEHGIGLHKMRFLALEHDAAAIDLMRAVKSAFDPKNILNPGKIFAALPAQPL